MFRGILAFAVRWVDRTLLAVAAAALVAMMLHICADILASLLLNAPFGTTSAIVTQYYMIAVAYLPILAAERRGAHISITLVTGRLALPVQQGLHLVVTLATTGVYALLSAQAFEQAADKLAIRAYMVEQTSRIEVWPSYFLIPAGFAAMTLLMAGKSVLLLSGHRPSAADALARGAGDV